LEPSSFLDIDILDIQCEHDAVVHVTLNKQSKTEVKKRCRTKVNPEKQTIQNTAKQN